MLFRREVTGIADLREMQVQILTTAQEHGVAGNALFEAKLTMEEALIGAVKKYGSNAKLLVEADISAAGVKLAVRQAG